MKSYSFLTDLVVEQDSFHGYRVFLEIYPIISDNQQTKFQPRFANEFEFNELINLLSLEQHDSTFVEEKFTRCGNENPGFRLKIH